MLGGSVKDKENARHMMRKMVNSMSAKMEIGSPMASMYILGNPDHYASHTYVTFAWRPYVQFVRGFWVADQDSQNPDEQQDDEEKIPIGRQDGRFIASSGVDDYRYRPVVYNNVTLYEWIQCSEKKKRNSQERADFEEDDAGYTAGLPEDDVSDWETDDEEDLILDKQAKIDKGKKPVRHPFSHEHDLFLSHSVMCKFENLTKVIPNFIGGAMPRSDKGDRAAYCMTILTLFKPWRSPLDLKDYQSTWDQAFKEHEFTDRQQELIKNFDIRYECNDARDDHFAQMKKKIAEAKASGKSLFPAGFMSYKDKFADDLNDFDYGSDDGDLEDVDDDCDEDKGPRTLKLLAEAKDLRSIMETSGWLDKPVNGLPYVDTDRFMAPTKSRAEWTSIIKHQRMELTANKLSNLPPVSNNRSDGKVKDDTSILPHDYFNHRSDVDAATNSDIVSSIIISFKLNKEQTRAFKLVADHAAGPQISPLRMYMGGMGGTGKSQVLKAIAEYFSRRNEAYRYMVLGPTGSVAALLNGST
ncbi:hypothetical protein C8R44DRAFT_554144, partial [Mycena epipterygia]